MHLCPLAEASRCENLQVNQPHHTWYLNAVCVCVWSRNESTLESCDILNVESGKFDKFLSN